MKNTTIAIDLAKSVFEVGISDQPGHVAHNHRLSRTALASFLAAQAPATVLMEACSSAHYWGRLGDIARFPSGRHLACYLGLTPREHSSGGRRRLGRISKQGERKKYNQGCGRVEPEKGVLACRSVTGYVN